MLWQSLPVYRKPRRPLEQAWSIHYTDYPLCLEKGSSSNQTWRRVKPVDSRPARSKMPRYKLWTGVCTHSVGILPLMLEWIEWLTSEVLWSICTTSSSRPWFANMVNWCTTEKTKRQKTCVAKLKNIKNSVCLFVWSGSLAPRMLKPFQLHCHLQLKRQP